MTIPPPAPAEILAERKKAGLTQEDAARLVHADVRSWQGWEGGTRKMPIARWELFRIKVAQRAEAAE